MLVTRPASLKQKLLMLCACLMATLLLASCAVVYSTPDKPASLINIVKPGIVSPSKKGLNENTLRVMTLNIAHGRGDGFSQMFQKKSTITSTLNDISTVVKRENPDLFALQEVDSSAVWSGYINEASHIASNANYPYITHGNHVRWFKLAYGTSLVSKYQLEDAKSVTFEPSPPTFSKGFVVSTVIIPEKANQRVDVVSVHLDFARDSVRLKQIDKMIEHLSQRRNPLIVMGDFNCEWGDENSALRIFAERMGLRAYKPDEKNMATFRMFNKRLDWVLVSSGFQFESCSTLPDIISDHNGVVCDLVYQG